MISHQARVGWGNPAIFGTTHRLRVTVTPSIAIGGLTDLSSVVGGYFRVMRQNGSSSTWTASLGAAPTTSSAVLLYTFTAADLPRAETLEITPVVRVPANVIDAYPFTLYVIA